MLPFDHDLTAKRSCRDAAGSADNADRSDAAGLDSVSRRGGAADDVRHALVKAATLIAELGDLSRGGLPKS
jgi:hypothetical protein